MRTGRVQRLTAGIFPAGEGDDWLHKLSSTSTPFGESPARGDDGDGEAAKPAPAKAPQGARDGQPERASAESWLSGAIDAARMGGAGWTTSVSEPGS